MKKLYFYLLMMPLLASVTMTSCESDEEIADYLISGNWEGYLGTYYENRWGELVKDGDYETVWRFDPAGYDRYGYATSGVGYEVDYSTRYRNDYAYSSFRWNVSNGNIYINYDDPNWSPVRIDWSDYSISYSHFRGTMYDWENRPYTFDLTNVASWNWDDYRYYRTRGATDGDDKDIYIGENGSSIATGIFAKAMKEKASR